ncbi:GPI anchor biosynthesis-related protein [Trichosporon asahii var. asahii CBS 2479]|uniref:GPI anchor biosynthesis-related protein n=1 Tax=Trichosporon asahii var. asahii (strain ATCC 90039 / CBS 2479 / JCM 2466 / KCTC 7840 / NBRC 103889/ NCYC 2677 / UAMH 7654) TaxID=1186058 RepID=J6EYX8_TRIAS|nr:GPI anchor biosynthesis-related protein [Trichosporon asahii var. asahii CBS 2479]EJT49879.1 GPI anchor biosynthesis-related protein [Trichosporon asahii var. asahii CBS 2479]
MYTANSERDEFNIITSDRLSIVAHVQAVDQPLENIDPAQRLVVYCENGVPVALSEPADVVLYTPAASVADLLIYESDRDASSRDNVPDDDILAMDTIPKRRSWAWMADVPRNLVFLGNSVTRFIRPVSNRGTPTFSRPGGARLPRFGWRTSEEWKVATQMPIPRLRRHGFGYRSDMAHGGGNGHWSDVTLQQVLPIIFVLLYICRRYWLPLVWQTLLAIIVIVAWAVYEMGISVLKGLAVLSGRLDFVKAIFLRAWHIIANARQWCASVDAVMFTWGLAARLDGMENNIGPIIGGIILHTLQPRYNLATVFVDPVIAAIDWLNSWPVGFKLNTELSNFMSSTLRFGLNVWKEMYMYMFVVAGTIAGLLTFLSHALDAFRLMTLHLRAGYLFTRALYRWQMSALGGLWNLFRGKRWNTLRHRTDSHAYDLDTLFLGTLLFTLSVFLAPTLVAYYGLFFIINAILVAVEGCLRLGIVFAKTCPWYELQLRARFPEALPGGVVFEAVALPEPSSKHVVPVQQMLRVKTTPKSYGEILAPMMANLRTELGSLKSRL